ncbi:hypothetical protein [Amycolatopsis sp. SID8362]|uniref:hypothetical protein n=1 Tax=Amycolatopsis sp. SID8362 TaxID=2690346 RepID=UPI0013683B1B|nr:hypothetical protein [Amycolatopsis sp. SID8362]NBH01919.1 hypothetical protein [Amycolatopsis sp. SID8362]NED38622.1 hypothetical protein [Amycolatopsis sp. SID8362]
MNITEANDTSRVLRYLLQLRTGGGRGPDDDVREAAVRLAGRVTKALHAGVTPDEVEAGWNR